MQRRELSTRFWRIEVCDDYLQSLFEVHFSEVDETISHLAPEWRSTIDTVARKVCQLNDTICKVEATLAEARDTLNHAERWIDRNGGARRH
jgi:hypothetical protein